MNRILVTGGAGFVGSLLIPELLNRGHYVRVLDNLMYHTHTLLPYFIEDNFEFRKGDVRDESAIRDAVEDVDIIIHLAAIVGAPACQKDKTLAEEVNLKGTITLDRLRRRDQPLIFASTGSNYGAVDGICTEESPLNPLSVYGITKTRAEQRVMDTGNAVAFRYATAFGLSPRLRLDLLVNDFVFQALKNGSLIVYEKHFKRTFIHVKDIAKSFLFAVENLEAMRDQVYNVGTENSNYTKEQIAEMIKRKVDYYLYFADFGSDPDQRDYDVSYQKIRDVGFTPEISVERGIDELLAGFQTVSLRRPYSNVD